MTCVIDVVRKLAPRERPSYAGAFAGEAISYIISCHRLEKLNATAAASAKWSFVDS